MIGFPLSLFRSSYKRKRNKELKDHLDNLKPRKTVVLEGLALHYEHRAHLTAELDKVNRNIEKLETLAKDGH